MGLRWHHGVPLACDATLVSPLHADGSPWAGADEADGVAIARAEASKRDRYPELVGSDVCRLVVLACETGGRWSQERLDLVRHLAAKKAQEAPRLLRTSARLAWSARWFGFLSVAAQSALAGSISEAPTRIMAEHDTEEPSLAEVLA